MCMCMYVHAGLFCVVSIVKTRMKGRNFRRGERTIGTHDTTRHDMIRQGSNLKAHCFGLSVSRDNEVTGHTSSWRTRQIGWKAEETVTRTLPIYHGNVTDWKAFGVEEEW